MVPHGSGQRITRFCCCRIFRFDCAVARRQNRGPVAQALHDALNQFHLFQLEVRFRVERNDLFECRFRRFEVFFAQVQNGSND